jgi:polysaccharide export outer membrane protein
LQETTVRLTEIRAKLQAVGDKLQYTALQKSRLMHGEGYTPRIILVRKDGKIRARVDANEDSELQPGDVIEISLQPAAASEPPGQ